MSNIPCYLIPFLVGAICGFLGYLLGRSFGRVNENSKDLDLQAKLDACLENSKNLSQKLKITDSDNTFSYDKKVLSPENFTSSAINQVIQNSLPEYDGKAVALIMGKKWKQDDLKIVEGIGPKIEELYHAAGIKTWTALSETPITISQEILAAAGDKFKMHNPGSWAKQAKMAADGNWTELKIWQDNHKGGKE
jgi:predicted flap endonuclease-1-like 5' DNA nuclease